MRLTLSTLILIIGLFFTAIAPVTALENKPIKMASTNAAIPTASTFVYGSASKDAYPEEGFPDTPTGNHQNLYLGYDSLYNKQKTQIYIQFNLPPLPAGARLISAKVEIYQYVAEATSSYGLSAYPVDCDWGEYTLTWNNRPCNSASMGSASFSPSIGWKSVDITDMVHEWYNGARVNRGLKLQAHDQSAPGGIFRSRECDASQCPGGEHPRLRVEYELDNVPPTGNLTSPVHNTRIGVGTVHISANASDNTGGSGINRVEFYVYYNGRWFLVGTDSNAPYYVDWSTPTGLRSQLLKFSIHIIDNAGNIAIDPNGGHFVTFVESKATPDIKENWVPRERRAYLNQRSLTDGWKKCSGASMAMILAMNGFINKDYGTMAAKANAMYSKVIINDIAYIYKMRDELRRQGMKSDYHGVLKGKAWQIIKQEIDAGRPVIVGSRKVTRGHFFVVVGYREKSNERELIVYDPYGRWKGCYGCYDKNSTSFSSHKGQWVFYDHDQIWGDWGKGIGYLITARSESQTAVIAALTEEPQTDPDEVSEEPEDNDTYDGVDIEGIFDIYLPIIVK